MKERTKKIFKTATLFTALALTIGLVTTISVNENEKTYLCETDRILDGFTLETAANAYPNGTDASHPAYSTGLEYSINEEVGTGELNDPHEASIARGQCTATAISVPEFYQKGSKYYKVVGIDHDGFNAHKPAKNESGSEIGSFDVTSITSLKEFKYIGSQAFAYTSIPSVEFSKNLTELSPSTFFHCKELETTSFIQLVGEAASISGTYAAITSIGDNCFTDCIKYTGFTLPRTLTRIGNGAYQNCFSLTSVFLPAPDIESEHLEVGDYAFAGCKKVTVVYFSSKVEAVGAHAFEGCVNAKGYSALPYSQLLTKLGKNGNGDWNYLFNGSDYDNAGNSDNFLDFTDRDDKGDLMYDKPYFYTLNGDGTCTLEIFDGSFNTDPTDTVMYNVIRTIPDTRGEGYPVGRIGQELFTNNTDMTELYMPNTVKSIGIAAFAGCTNLETIALSSSLVEIEAYAFAPWNGASTETKGNNLTSLEIPASVEEIGDYAFPYMYDMMNIQFLGSKDGTSQLKHIGEYAFYKAGWSYKDTCYEGGSFAEVRNPLVLNMKPKLSSGYIEADQNSLGRPKSGRDTYTEIGKFAFFGNQWMGSIRIKSNTLVTDGFVFANCFWLVEADLGEGLVILGNGKNKDDGDGKPARNDRGRLFSVCVDESNVNIAQPVNVNPNVITDLGNPCEDDSDALTNRPLVPMSSFYLPALRSGQSTGQGTLDGRYHTMIYTKSVSNWFFQWKGGWSGYCDLQPAYLDMGSVSTSSEGNQTKGNDKFNNEYYGVDTAYGSTYIQSSSGTTFYQLKQGGYFEITYAHASVNEEGGQYTATYTDENGDEITSINTQKRYGFTMYDPDTGRAKFDFIQTAKNSNKLILAKFHYNPYWEQSKDVVIPETVTFGGRTFTVTEIGNCAFFRNICPQTHAWVDSHKGNSYNVRTYVSPQSDNSTTNPNKDAAGEFYADHNNDYYNLESVTLPNTITRIGGNAFYMCAGLQSIKTAGNATEGRLPDTLQKIGQYAFSFSAITAISLPKSVTHLGNASQLCNPFSSCMALQTISIDANGSAYKSLNNFITNTAGTTIVMSPHGSTSTSVTIPSGTEVLSSLSFRGARKVTTITIPTSLKTIETGCFEGIYYGENNMDHGNGDSNSGQRGDQTSKGVYARRKSALTTMSVAGGATSGLETIGDCAFYYCDHFNGITFPNVLKTIGNFAFYHCDPSNNYYIPDTLEEVGTQAFAKNKNFNTIRTDGKPTGEAQGYLNLAGTSLRNIGSEAFKPYSSGTAQFTKVSLPKTLTTINNGRIFTENYTGLTEAYVHNSTVEMNSGVFKGHSNMTVFKTWSGDVDASGDIQNVSGTNALPANLTTIGEGCFSSCSGLTSFGTFPASLTTVGKSAFYSCNNAGFTDADFSDSSSDLLIRDSAFAECKKLTSVTLVDSLGSRDKAGGTLTIEANAFKNCTALTTYVIIPRNSVVKGSSFTGSKITQVFVCDTFADGSVNVPASVASGTPAQGSVYYYAANTSDAASTPNGTKFWHYVGTTPTPWTPHD